MQIRRRTVARVIVAGGVLVFLLWAVPFYAQEQTESEGKIRLIQINFVIEATERAQASDPAVVEIQVAVKRGLGPGDFNGDGVVNLKDFTLFVNAYWQPMTLEQAKFDLDGNGSINHYDLFIFANHISEKQDE